MLFGKALECLFIQLDDLAVEGALLRIATNVGEGRYGSVIERIDDHVGLIIFMSLDLGQLVDVGVRKAELTRPSPLGLCGFGFCFAPSPRRRVRNRDSRAAGADDDFYGFFGLSGLLDLVGALAVDALRSSPMEVDAFVLHGSCEPGLR